MSENESANETQVRALFQSLLDRWNAGDAEAYANLFVEDVDYIAFDGTKQKGRKAVFKSHQPLFAKWLRGSQLVGEIEEIRFISPTVAIVISTGNTILQGQANPDPARLSRQTLVAIEQNGVWKFASFQNTRLRPMTDQIFSFLAWKITDGFWNLLNLPRHYPKH